MLKIKKPTNLKSAGDKVKKLGKKLKNVPSNKNEVKDDHPMVKEITETKTISNLPTTLQAPKSDKKLIKSEKKIKKISKVTRNSIEGTTKASRNKIVKKFKPPTSNFDNAKPINKSKIKSKDLHGDGDKKAKSIQSGGTGHSKAKGKYKFGKKSQKKRVAKEGELVPSLEEAPPFDQEHFNSIIKQDKIKRIVQVLNKLVKNESTKMKNLIFSDYKYKLNVTCFKIPSVPKRVVKLKVKHSIADEDTLLIVKDLQRGLKIDYEPTNQHYQDLLRENGVEGIKSVMSFNQLKTEYSTYEMKLKLSNLYDYYLCDGAIVGHVVGFLGKIFSSKTRCTTYAVRMSNPKLVKTEINKALHKTSYKQGQKGNLITIPIGTHKMTPGQIADNVLHVIGQLKTIYPGGIANIRNMTLGISLKGTSALPIYINMGKPLEATPYIIGRREDKLSKLKEEANKILSQFELTKSGGISRLINETEEKNLKRKRANGLDDDDDDDDDNAIVPDEVKQKKKKVKESKETVKKSESHDESEKDETNENKENDSSDDEVNEAVSEDEDSN